MYDHGAHGWAVVHPFDDPLVMAGQGTVGLEIVDDLPGVTDVIVSIGGGGLMGGVATAVKSLRPQARIWGVETVGADCMAQALAAGHIVTLDIDPVERRRGLGTLLMQTAEEQMRQGGAGVLSLEVAENNPAAQQFYRSLGFVTRGRIAKYYGGVVDAEVMEKVIEPA